MMDDSAQTYQKQIVNAEVCREIFSIKKIRSKGWSGKNGHKKQPNNILGNTKKEREN